MKRLALIVEGHGDAAALPGLVTRILRDRLGVFDFALEPPHRLKRHQMTQMHKLSTAVELQARKVGPEGAILIVLDADDDCPVTLATSLLGIAKGQRTDRRIEVVVANRTFESWIIASAETLRGTKGLRSDVVPPTDPDSLSSPKKWLSDRMENGYGETVDQPALSAALDLEQASRSRSFRKLIRALENLLAPPRPAGGNESNDAQLTLGLSS